MKTDELYVALYTGIPEIHIILIQRVIRKNISPGKKEALKVEMDTKSFQLKKIYFDFFY